jgi:hypothetical protein
MYCTLEATTYGQLPVMAAGKFLSSVYLSLPPITREALQWSDDGKIAVVTEQVVNVLDIVGCDHDNDGKAVYKITVVKADWPLWTPNVGVLSSNTTDKIADAVSLDRTVFPAVNIDPSPLSFKAVSWTPAGCSSTGGCLLVTLTVDHRVVVHMPPPLTQRQWNQKMDISQLIFNYCKCQPSIWSAKGKIKMKTKPGRK